jgi:hypothetical protein
VATLLAASAWASRTSSVVRARESYRPVAEHREVRAGSTPLAAAIKKRGFDSPFFVFFDDLS